VIVPILPQVANDTAAYLIMRKAQMIRKDEMWFKRMLVAGCVACFLTLFVGMATAKDISKKAGTTGLAFLKLGVGAKAVAMGGAFTAVADDPSGISYNPAGTKFLAGKQFLADYHNYVLDIQSGFIAHTRPFTADLSGGVFIDYLNFGDFTRTDINGVPSGEFSGGDFLIGANLSYLIRPELAAGVNVKYMHEAADGYGVDAVAADIGLLMKLPDSLTKVGLTFYNLGGVISGYTDHKDKLPMGVRAGVSHSLRELPLVVALDGVLPNDNSFYGNAGVEFYKFKPLYLRLGYSLFGENYKTGSGSDTWGGLAAGFGLDVKDYHISYAFMPYLDLGTSHRVTVSGGF
jgi:hypothetical protein